MLLVNYNNDNLNYVRVIHTVPDAPGVDVYANDMLLFSNVTFGEYTKYVAVPKGEYVISLYVTGTKDTPVLQNVVSLSENNVVTIAAAGMLSNIELLLIRDTCEGMSKRNSLIRFVHLSPNAPAVDITMPDGTIIFGNVSFQQLTRYIAVLPMTYTLQVRVAGTDKVVLTVPGIMLEKNKCYTVYAIGLVGATPELKALLVEDGIMSMK